MGDFPLMTKGGTFVINGAERVIVSQIVRSPGMYYGHEVDKADQHTYTATVIPYRGAWLEYETDNANVFYVRIDKNRKLPITCLIRALGVQTDAADQADLFGEDARILATMEKDTCQDPGGVPAGDLPPPAPGRAAHGGDRHDAHLEALFFDAQPLRREHASAAINSIRRWTSGAACRGQKLAEPIADPMTGEILAMPGEVISREQAHEI